MSTDFISPTLKGTKKCPIPKFELFFLFFIQFQCIFLENTHLYELTLSQFRKWVYFY